VVFDLSQWKVVAELLPQFLERQASGVLALAAVCAVEISIVDVCEGGGLEFGVFHGPTLPPAGCGLLLYKSYSLGTERILYKADAAAGTAKTMRKIGASSLIE
jgi:hypothetical protein